jgi:hypothetical protein
LPGQLFLPGMESMQDSKEVSDGDQPSTCPNCGGTEFDEDGDCTSCWEPAVVKLAGHGRTIINGRR